MHYTLHLTQTIGNTTLCMSSETALQVRHLAPPGSSLTFMVADPAIDEKTAATVIHRIRTIVEDPQDTFFYRMTTAGVGLDADFLTYANDHHIAITFAWDGLQSLTSAKTLLRYQPHAAVVLTVTPETLAQFADNIKILYAMHFRYLYVTMDPGAPWEEAHLPQLKRQYRTIASFYRETNRREEKLFFSPFDTKIADRIQQRQVQCVLGQQVISVTPDGKLYPCFALCEESFCIGDLTHGIDEAKRKQLQHLNDKEAIECVGCAIHDRCVHHCACINRCATGSITSPSPFQCAHERILIPITDSLAERLYHERNALFMQKQYNTLYPTLSLAEEE